jgi:hypothetical protein
MSERDIRAIVGDLYDDYARREFDRVAALMHDDIDLGDLRADVGVPVRRRAASHRLEHLGAVAAIEQTLARQLQVS